MAKEFYDKLKDYIPKQWKGKKLVGLNERLRFLKYEQGDFFRQHYDGHYMRDDSSEISYITVQIYLNGNFTGGETTFYNKRMKIKDVVPESGKCLLFEHEILHCGRTLKNGVKYAIRTDVMYKN